MILALNTSTPQFSVAFMDEDGSLRAEYVMTRGARRFGGLMPSLHFVLTDLDASVHDLSCVIIAVGPGSFTGLRVGLSVAKGLCHGLGIPMVGVSSLEALARLLPCPDLPVGALLASRRGEVFTAAFSWGNHGSPERRSEDTCLTFERLPSCYDESTLFIGNDLHSQGPMLRRVFGPDVRLAAPHFWTTRASGVGAAGLSRYLAGDVDDPRAVDPVYYRPPDIRPNPYASCFKATR